MKRKLSRLLFFVMLLLAVFFGWQYYKEHRFDPLIVNAAKRYDVPPALVKAVIWQETRFDPSARGKAGEIGLMQIRSAAAGEWAEAEKIEGFQHEDILDPGKNILAGTWYLSKMLKRYRQTDNAVPYALADYNAGRGNVLKWLSGPATTNSLAFVEQIGFPSTRKYAVNIMRRRLRYEDEFANQ